MTIDEIQDVCRLSYEFGQIYNQINDRIEEIPKKEFYDIALMCCALADHLKREHDRRESSRN